MSIGLVLIPVLSALIGWLTIYGTYRWILLPKATELLPQIGGTAFDNLGDEKQFHEILVKKFEELNLAREAGPLLDKKLDTMIQDVKLQIPMVAMFLSPPLAIKLKALAKVELIKMIPELQVKLIDKFHQVNFKEIVEAKLKSIPKEKVRDLGKKILGPLVVKYAYFTAAFGFIVGLIQILLLKFFE